MSKHRRALCLLYFSTKSFYVNLSNIKCHSEVSLSGSSRLASAKVRRSYITTKLSSHFFHGPSAENMHISCTKPSKTADLRPEKIFQLFLAADCKCEKKIRLLQENSMKTGPNMLNNIFIALRTPQSPRLLHKTHPARPHHAHPTPRACRCRKNDSSTASTACRAAGCNNGKPWNKTQMPWKKACTAGELFPTASILGGDGDRKKEMLRKKFYVRREFFYVRRDVFYVASVGGCLYAWQKGKWRRAGNRRLRAREAVHERLTHLFALPIIYKGDAAVPCSCIISYTSLSMECICKGAKTREERSKRENKTRHTPRKESITQGKGGCRISKPQRPPIYKEKGEALYYRAADNATS